jgi:molybdenum cofactor guanylyltransferase
VRVAGLLLTGGASRRLGIPKATLVRDGERLVDRGARVLGAVCTVVVEVGPGFGSLPSVRERPPGEGPLAALVAGAASIAKSGLPEPVLALAVDLPFVEVPLLRWLAAHPSQRAVVPVVDGIPQTLCARYPPGAIEVAGELLRAGERSVRALLAAIDVDEVGEREWGKVADAHAFTDVDTADDVARAGLDLPG